MVIRISEKEKEKESLYDDLDMINEYLDLHSSENKDLKTKIECLIMKTENENLSEIKIIDDDKNISEIENKTECIVNTKPTENIKSKPTENIKSKPTENIKSKPTENIKIQTTEKNGHTSEIENSNHEKLIPNFKTEIREAEHKEIEESSGGQIYCFLDEMEVKEKEISRKIPENSDFKASNLNEKTIEQTFAISEETSQVDKDIYEKIKQVEEREKESDFSNILRSISRENQPSNLDESEFSSRKFIEISSSANSSSLKQNMKNDINCLSISSGQSTIIQSTGSPNLNFQKPQKTITVIRNTSKFVELNLKTLKSTKKPKKKYGNVVYDIGDLEINDESFQYSKRNTTEGFHDNSFQSSSFPTVSTFLKGLRMNDGANTPPVLNRTYLSDIENGASNIDNAKEYYDIKSKKLFGSLTLKRNKTLKTENNVQLEDNYLVCFDSKKTTYLASDDPLSSFRFSDDPDMCYKQLFKVDLRDSKLFVAVGEAPKIGWYHVICCVSKEKRERLFNIIDTHVHKIVEVDGKYRLYMTNNENNEFLIVRSLEFVLFSKGVYYTFEAKNILNFLKWITTISVRHMNE